MPRRPPSDVSEECKWAYELFTGEKAEKALQLCIRGYTLRKMALMTPMELMDLLGYEDLTDAEKAARRLRQAAGIDSKPMTISELKKRQDKTLKTGIEEFDEKTPWKGIKFGLVYGFAGEYGTGKSLFAKQVSAVALASGMKVAYFDTEGTFDVDDSTIYAMFKRFNVPEDAYTRLWIYRPVDSFQLQEQLRELPEDVDVVVVDSVVALPRAEFRGRQMLAPRQQTILYMLNLLLRFARIGKLVIVTDQVMDVPAFFALKRPAGGNVLLHTVQALFMMERLSKQKLEGVMWPLDVPGMSPSEEIKYRIREDGLY